jgi:hypothetical protein
MSPAEITALAQARALLRERRRLMENNRRRRIDRQSPIAVGGPEHDAALLLLRRGSSADKTLALRFLPPRQRAVALTAIRRRAAKGQPDHATPASVRQEIVDSVTALLSDTLTPMLPEHATRLAKANEATRALVLDNVRRDIAHDIRGVALAVLLSLDIYEG